jgi:hypothetical protein
VWGLYARGEGSQLVLLAIYIDDTIVAGPSLGRVQWAKDELAKQYHITDKGKLCWYLGIHIGYCNRGIFLTQQTYTQEIVRKYADADLKIQTTPIRLLSESKRDVSTWEAKEIREFPYMEIVGSLMYLANAIQDLT